MPTNDGFSGVSNCYVFKSRLQEYAQKVGLPTPVYETIKEGPSHEPCFRSTVIVNDVRYDSLPGFFNRKAAEQSAAEVALLELVKHGEVNQRISQPVHETGLCKNLLQEYAQKMNYAIPLYQCQKDEAPGKVHFTCTVEIGGIRYIGAAAKTKKEAEIKAARTALLAIQELSGKSVGNSQLTVIPCRKRGAAEMANSAEEIKAPKAKKCRFKKKMLKKKRSGGRTEHTQVQGTGNLVNTHVDHKGSKIDQTNTSGFQLVRAELLATDSTMNCQEGRSDTEPNQREVLVLNDALAHRFGGEPGDSESVQSAVANCNHSSNESADTDISSVPFGFSTALATKVNDATPDVFASSGSYEPTTALPRDSNKGTRDVGTFSVSYEPTTASTKEMNEATRVMEAASMMNSSISALPKESNKVTPDVGTYSKTYEPRTASAKELNGTTAVMEATSLMNNSILGQMESSSCVIPGVNQPEERVQAGTSQA